jgi:heterodisulfide reductase subunit A-like polyferredoxin
MSTASENPRAPKKEEEERYQFVVVGAGPAGLTAVANLIDMGVSRIAWIDLSFSGGRMGEKYREIPRFVLKNTSPFDFDSSCSYVIRRKLITRCP